MIRRILVVFALVLIFPALFAGDMAVFMNLGFSPDSETFLFGQYGVDGATNYAWAGLYFVDVDENAFHSGGVHNKTYEQQTPAFNDGIGALLNLLAEKTVKVKDHRIDHLKTGRVVYLMHNGETPKELITFRDFRSNDRYEVSLAQDTRGEGERISAAFHLKIKRTLKSGAVREFTVGLPRYYREGISSYRVKQIVFAPDESSLVFVVEKTAFRDNGSDIRYMVETLSLE